MILQTTLVHASVLSLFVYVMVTGDRGGVPSTKGFHCPDIDICPSCLTCAEACNVHPSHCYIKDKCVLSGSSNPDDRNQICKPLINNLDWTEEYEDMPTKGVLLEMNLKDQTKMDQLIIVACDALQDKVKDFCRQPENEELCVSSLCSLIGVDRSTTDMSRPIIIKLKKCWIDPYYGDPVQNVKWRFYAKMDISRYDLEEMCYGYHLNTETTDKYWLLPNCILEPATWLSKDHWQMQLVIEINSITGYCESTTTATTTTRNTSESSLNDRQSDIGSSLVKKGESSAMSPLYWALIGLAALVVILITIITLVCVRKRKQSNGSTGSTTSPPAYYANDAVVYSNQPGNTHPPSDNTNIEPFSISRPALSAFPEAGASSPPILPPAYNQEYNGKGSEWVAHLDGIPLKQ